MGNVENYIRKFESIAMYINNATDEELTHKFIFGL